MDKPNVKLKLKLLGPAAATALLGANLKNRLLRDKRVRTMAAQMLAGEWGLSWDAIAIDADGNLANGQHRLHAVILSGVSCWFIVVDGIEKIDVDVGDRGWRRTIDDIFYIDGEPNSRRLGSLVRAFWIFEDTGVPVGGGGVQTGELLPNEARSLLGAEPTLREFVGSGGTTRLSAAISPTSNAILRFLFTAVNRDDAEAFFKAVIDGQEEGKGLDAEDPRFALRERLRRELESPSNSPARHKAAWIILAWNAYVRGEPKVMLKFKPGGRRPQKFPLIEGWEYSSHQLQALGYEEEEPPQ